MSLKFATLEGNEVKKIIHILHVYTTNIKFVCRFSVS